MEGGERGKRKGDRSRNLLNYAKRGFEEKRTRGNGVKGDGKKHQLHFHWGGKHMVSQSLKKKEGECKKKQGVGKRWIFECAVEKERGPEKGGLRNDFFVRIKEASVFHIGDVCAGEGRWD